MNGKASQGTILIFALWALGLLSMLATTVGFMCREKILLLSSLERKSQLRFVTDTGIKQAIKVLSVNRAALSPALKMLMHNDQSGSFVISGRNYQVQVSHDNFTDNSELEGAHLGVVDEESKLNLNTASFFELQALLKRILKLEERSALNLAASFIEWREGVRQEISQFFKDSLYNNPGYPPKRGKFEVSEEILLVKGMREAFYEELLPYVTIYGDGRVNINTASYAVLLALGLDEKIAKKIVVYRRGNDGEEATADDNIFIASHLMIEQLQSFVDLKQEEIDQIDKLNIESRFKANSDYFLIESKGRLTTNNEIKTIKCVYNFLDNRLEYWREI